MANDYNSYSRVDRFDKRRKNTKAISWLFVVGGVLIVLLIAIFVFGDNDDSLADDEEERVGSEQDSSDDDDEPISTEESNSQNGQPSSNQSNEEAEVEDEVEDETVNASSDEVELEAVSSEDDNVSEAFTGNWEPVDSSQDKPYQIPWNEWDKESQDWHEMLEAVRLVTRLHEDDMITWWVTNDGPQKLKATVTNKAQTENYRVYITLLENEGWLPTRVEILKENDKKQMTDGNEQNEEDDTTTNVEDTIEEEAATEETTE